jgi:phosphatidylserine/phosphatidylglycerophosphate/cardiolipin synthase-like enzyme
MSVVRVAVPLFKGKRKFFLEKGRPWSIVEQVFLVALVTQPATVDELARDANVPRRLVLEALIRLMRAGWIEFRQETHGLVFSASNSGAEVADNEELPKISKPMNRWMNFVVDRVTGTLYRTRELPPFERHVVERRAERERLVWLDPNEVPGRADPSSMLSALFSDDERFLSMEQSGERLVERYAVVTVRNAQVEDLPPRAPKALTQAVLNAAAKATAKPSGVESPKVKASVPTGTSDDVSPTCAKATFRASDLILGGDSHKQLIVEALRKARQRVIVHSTFVDTDRLLELRPLIFDAAKRGVVVDILWGESEDKAGVVRSRDATLTLRQEVERAGLSDVLRVQAFSTRSHAKLLVYDEPRTGDFCAVVGSCNWLASPFVAYEASARFSDPRVVGPLVQQLADLSCGPSGVWNSLTNELASLGDAISRRRPTPGPSANVAIVLGAHHGEFVRIARDSAIRRLFVTSHRMGAATRPAIVVPAAAAVRERGLEVTAYYGIQNETITSSQAAIITRSSAEIGVQINVVIEPRLHAKVLAWDDDNVLITSQNWLSADPDTSNPRSEIGVFIQGHGLAKQVVEHFEASRRY